MELYVKADGAYVFYGALTGWPSASEWMIPGTYDDN